jgi:hypothetical protein
VDGCFLVRPWIVRWDICAWIAGTGANGVSGFLVWTCKGEKIKAYLFEPVSLSICVNSMTAS